MDVKNNDNNNNGKQMKIDSILSEINTSIKAEVSKAGDIEPVSNENQEQKIAKKKKNRNKQVKPKPEKAEKPGKPEKPEKDESLKMSINSSFVESARIIEDAVEDNEQPQSPTSHSVRFIAVTASEVVEDQPLINQSFVSDIVQDVTETTDIEQEISRGNNRHIKKIRKKRQRGKLSRRQRINAVFGLIMSFFIVIGVIATIWFTVKTTGEIVNNTSQKEELAQVIFPFVIIDISAFADVAALDNTAIVSSAIWQFIIDEQDKSKYQRDELGSIYVPDVDIEYYIRMLFGNDVIIKHQSVENSNVMMNYDSESKMYNIESTPKLLPYKPRVDKISKKDEIYTLKVSYILPDAMWNFNVSNKIEQVDKTMEYVLKKNKNSYQLLSVKMLSVTGLSSSNYINSSGIGMSSEDVSDFSPNSQLGEPAVSIPDDGTITIPNNDLMPPIDDGASAFSGDGTDNTSSETQDSEMDETTSSE